MRGRFLSDHVSCICNGGTIYLRSVHAERSTCIGGVVHERLSRKVETLSDEVALRTFVPLTLLSRASTLVRRISSYDRGFSCDGGRSRSLSSNVPTNIYADRVDYDGFVESFDFVGDSYLRSLDNGFCSSCRDSFARCRAIQRNTTLGPLRSRPQSSASWRTSPPLYPERANGTQDLRAP